MKISETEIVCSKCGDVLPPSAYYKDVHSPTGRKSQCKKCVLKRKNGKIQKPEKMRETLSEPAAEKLADLSDDELDVASIAEIIPTEYPEFVLEKQCKPAEMFSMAIVGSRKSGKTTFLYNEFEKYVDKFDFIVVCSNSIQAHTYDWLKEGVYEDKVALFDEYNGGLIGYLEKFQRQTQNALKILILLDDCSSLTRVKNSDELLQLYIRGRNMRMSVIVSTQSPMLINKNSRQNTDFLVLLKCRTADMKENVADHFIRGHVPIPPRLTRLLWPQREYLFQWMEQNTENHGVRIFDFIADEIFSYHAKKQIPAVTM